MEHRSTGQGVESTVCWESLEAWTREQIQAFIQAVLEEEVTVFLGRRKSERRQAVERIIPLADGGAYATDFQGGLWYLRSTQGTKVKGLPLDADVSELIPVADGGAYLAGTGVWYLRGMPQPKSARRKQHEAKS